MGHATDLYYAVKEITELKQKVLDLEKEIARLKRQQLTKDEASVVYVAIGNIIADTADYWSTWQAEMSDGKGIIHDRNTLDNANTEFRLLNSAIEKIGKLRKKD